MFSDIEDLRENANTDEFESNDLALSACPTKTKVCGKKNIVLEDEFTVPVKLGVENFDGNEDSCHWLIKAQCGLPTIQISKVTE